MEQTIFRSKQHVFILPFFQHHKNREPDETHTIFNQNNLVPEIWTQSSAPVDLPSYFYGSYVALEQI